MTLLLREKDVDRLVTMADTIAAVQRAEAARGAGLAFVNPRQRMRVPGGILHRKSSDEITVFHSMGSALWDVATAALAVAPAREQGVGDEISLDDPGC